MSAAQRTTRPHPLRPVSLAREYGARLLAAVAVVALAAGGVLTWAGSGGAGKALWSAGVIVVAVPLAASVLAALARRTLGVDAIALLAMAGSLALGEQLAGAVIALMYAGGQALEAAASRRARRALTALLERAPRVAHRRRGDAIEEVPVDDVAPGNTVLVRAGELVPVDGALTSERAVVDEATLTGEPLPVTVRRGGPLRSGSANAGDAFELRATRPASESAYAAIVRLVREAERRRAPLVRMADRYAGVFLPVTLGVAGLAWGLSGDAVRALAVLVVATPCPLILAAPIAMVAGLSRSARTGVIVKGTAALEALARARSVLFDKTGTLTLGRPEIEEVSVRDGVGRDELVRLAASVDQLSAHVLAEALVHEAEREGLALASPTDVTERPGAGIEGIVEGRRVALGSAGWLAGRGVALDAPGGAAAPADGRASVLVAVDGRLAGAIVMGDRVRPDARAVVEELRRDGVRVAMVTGDDAQVARAVGGGLGLDEVYADCTPSDKVDAVQRLQADPDRRPVAVIGDGVNDAPALALADVGVAMGAAGATIAAEAADAVIAVDRVDRVADAVRIGRRSLGIARQSVLAGMGLSLCAMAFAALGLLPPLAGALLQEAIDVAVILNALRALR